MGDVADLLMPKLGLTMTEGTVARWLVSPGQRFSAGDTIVIIETDKIANDVEAPASGEMTALCSFAAVCSQTRRRPLTTSSTETSRPIAAAPTPAVRDSWNNERPSRDHPVGAENSRPVSASRRSSPVARLRSASLGGPWYRYSVPSARRPPSGAQTGAPSSPASWVRGSRVPRARSPSQTS